MTRPVLSRAVTPWPGALRVAPEGRDRRTAARTPLRPREDTDLPGRIARSAYATTSARFSLADFADWFARRRLAHNFQVERIPLDLLDGWSFAPGTGNLAHHSGNFFTVEGLDVAVGPGAAQTWRQPIIVQPEVGILGILAREIDGVLHFLMQAKMEPGNPNLLQLSPTVQATRSNYTRVHGGAAVRHLEYFTGHPSARVLVDVLQSEHGDFFYRKANRNMIVEIDHDVPADDDFRWMTLGQIGVLLRRDNVVNMDSRTVLACAPVARSEPGVLTTDTELLSWFTAERARHDLVAQRVPLTQVTDWTRGPSAISHRRDRHMRVIGVSVLAGSREVTRWTQPLLEPVRRGLAAFVVRYFNGVPHLLAHARVEGGFLDTVELGPTVQDAAGFDAANTAEPQLAALLSGVAPDRVRYDAVHAEEGGRFYHAEMRYLIVDAGTRAPRHPPRGYQWVTPGQLTFLVRHGRYVNVQARTLLAVLTSRAVEL